MQKAKEERKLSIYIAAPYTGIVHAQSVAYRLQIQGFTIASSWLNDQNNESSDREEIVEWLEQGTPAEFCDGRGNVQIHSAYGQNHGKEQENHESCSHGYCQYRYGEDSTKRAAMQNMEDVKGCDVMLFLPDDGRGEAQNTPGKFVEMGIALAMGKPIVRVKGGDRSVFDAASGVQEVQGINEALTKLDEWDLGVDPNC